MPTQILVMFAKLAGGLAFFLYGMNMMSDGLRKMTGGGLERTLKRVTSNDFLGFFLGGGITVAIQSSSAMTVMLVGLVNSGIIDFKNTFGLIMGSNVGTTFTAWLTSLVSQAGGGFLMTLLQPMTFAPILAFCGIVMQMLSKKESRKNAGIIFIGFAILMTGMEMMGNSMKSVRETDVFTSLLTAFSAPIIALLISTVFTGIIQSSAATIGIVQAMTVSIGLNGVMQAPKLVLTYGMAIPLVLGANIGTCMTALISSIGANKNAKRVVVMHILANTIGSLICVVIMYIAQFFDIDVLNNFLNKPATAFGIAIVHTCFNVFNTLFLAPIKNYVIRFCEKCVPEKINVLIKGV